MASSGGAISQRPSQTSLTAGDFNADGRLDVATSTPDPGGAEVWINGRGAAQPALTLTGVSLQRSCLSARRTVVQGTNRKLTIRYTLNDAARLSVTVKRQVRPRASAPTRCLSGRSARRGVKFAKVGSFRVRGGRGGKSVTLDTNGALKAPGESPPPLSRRLEPGRYELVLQGLRLDDGSRSRKATVAFTVLR